MRFRKLRIAWSVLCVIACVLLIVLWVRSYSKFDSSLYKLGPIAFEEASGDGVVVIGIIKNPNSVLRPAWTVQHQYHRMKDFNKWVEFANKHTNVLGFGGINDSFESALIVPFWFLCIASAFFAALLWPIKPWRFRLRTLLIAMTILAVALGLAVYAANK